jgi:hypothetical protein
MDFDLLVRIKDEKFAFIPKPLVYFAPGGASHFQFKQGLKEVQQSYRRYIGKSYKMVLWQMRQQALTYLMLTKLGKTLFQLKNRKQIAGEKKQVETTY